MAKTLLLATVTGLAGLVAAQSAPITKFPDRAVLRHDGSRLTVVANDSLPLFQAINAVRLESGWQVNWESAPGYSHFDLVDDTAQKWRATHPAENGVTRPAGGLFTATVPEPNESDSNAEQLILMKLVEKYNSTGNPGRYIVQLDSNRVLTVIGEQVRDETGAFRKITPLLDTPITLPRSERSVEETINSILAALESATGKRIVFAELSHSLSMSTQANIGGERMTARDLLEQALASTQKTIQYDMCYDADVPAYVFSTSIAMRPGHDGTGGR